MTPWVASLVILAELFSLGFFGSRWYRARRLLAGVAGNPPGTAPGAASPSRLVKQQTADEFQHQLGLAATPLAGLRIPVAAGVAGGLATLWQDRALAVGLFAAGVGVAAVCAGFAQAAAASRRKARERFQLGRTGALGNTRARGIPSAPQHDAPPRP